VDDVWALLDHLNVGRSYVLASSFGATVALLALRARPERLPRAVLVGGFARRPLRRAEWLLAAAARFLPGTLRSVPLWERALRAAHGAAFADRPPELWRHFAESAGRAPLAALARRALWLGRLDLRPVLPEVRQPVLLVCGDAVAPPAQTEVLLRGLPSAGRVVLEGCGHLPCYTHPDALADVVRRFLTPPGVCSGAGCGTAGGPLHGP
jgi:3-oxoadipate enol-lactonase